MTGRFHLPRLGVYDRRARSIAPSLDPSQRPRAPLILPPRSCPPGAYASSTTLAGQVVRVINRADEAAIVIHIAAASEPARLVIGSQTSLEDRRGRTLTLAGFNRGDRVRASGVPSPDKALVYLSNRIQDSDVVAVAGGAWQRVPRRL